MHEYDVTLKGLLSRVGGSALAELTGFAVERWHNVELPAVRHRRADLLGETASGELVYIELQSTNHTHMARRMLEYSLAIQRRFHRFPEQIVLYVGNTPLRMDGRLTARRLSFECTMADVREIDGEPLLSSERLADNVIAILLRLRSERDGVRRILARIAAAAAEERSAALGELMILAGLRKLGTVIEREIEQMPILDDIMDHEVIGRERKLGIALGLAEGLAEGERRLILGMIAKRFGSPPDWIRKRLDLLPAVDLERIGLRLLDAQNVEELFD